MAVDAAAGCPGIEHLDDVNVAPGKVGFQALSCGFVRSGVAETCRDDKPVANQPVHVVGVEGHAPMDHRSVDGIADDGESGCGDGLRGILEDFARVGGAACVFRAPRDNDGVAVDEAGDAVDMSVGEVAPLAPLR